jgi:hypothetical protein
VTLTRDPTQETVDPYGRSLFYVDRGDGLDVGLQMIRNGWAIALWPEAHPPQRLDEYLDADEEAEKRNAGIGRLCGGDIHLDLLEQRRDSAEAFVRLYYRRISNHQFLRAWRMLGKRRKAQLRPFRQWKAGFRRSLGVSVVAANAVLAEPRRVFVDVRLRSRVRDACSRRVVTQYIRGNAVIAPHRDSWLVVEFQLRKTRCTTPRTECT